MPRLHFPPRGLISRDWEHCISIWSISWALEEMVAHSLVPVKLLLGELVGTRMLEESLLKLGVDGVELLESSLLSHGRFW